MDARVTSKFYQTCVSYIALCESLIGHIMTIATICVGFPFLGLEQIITYSNQTIL